MKILAANLKHFYQRRILWLLYVAFLWLLLMLHFMLHSQDSPERIPVYYAFIGLLLGFVTADLQKSVLTKPFSFCMPKHKAVPRHFILAVGGIVNLLLAIGFSRYWYYQVAFPYVLLTIFAAASAGMIFYLLGVWVTFVLKIPALLGYVWIVFMALTFFEVDTPLNRMLISSPLQVIMAGILACAFTWKWFGNESLARKFCGQEMLGLGDGWNFAKTQKYRKKKAVEKLSRKGSVISDRLGEFFLVRMKRCRAFSANRYVLGNCYIMLDSLFGARWTAYVLSLIGLVLFFGYYFEGMMQEFFFVMPVFLTFRLDLVPHPSILLPAGRTERWCGAVVSGLAVTALATLVMAALAFMSVRLGPLLPDITLKGSSYAFHALDTRESYVCLLLMPLALIVSTLFRNKAVARFVIMGVIMTWIFFSVFGMRPSLLSLIGLRGVVILVTASWICFALLLGYHFRRRSLVGQSA